MATFDTIIVGAGSAGCVLADRLSASGREVLLLEAGGSDDRQEVQIPAAFNKLFKGPVDWGYHTAPQRHLNGRRLYWPRGKMLGGCSSINAMIVQRGHPSTYDAWAAQGNPGWSWEELLPYFKRSEHQERIQNAYHGVEGPLNVADLRDPNPLSRAFVAAALELGHPHNDDFNDGQQEGFGLYQVSQKGGRRWSAADAYLKPALGRRNLHVETHAHVTRLVIEGGRCRGVSFEQRGRQLTHHASQEVILCAGAIGSPQLLMLSGVGDEAHLRDVGVRVTHHLPGVGQNLQDHLAVMAAYACTEPVSLEHAETLPNVARYLLRGRGPLTSNVGEAGGFVRVDPELEAPDLQFHFGPAYFINHGFVEPGGAGFSIGPTLVQPYSRGRITLRGPSHRAHPHIEPNYLEDERDMHVLVEGLKLARRIAHTRALAPYQGGETLPGADARSDEDWRDHVRAYVETLYHPVGTCAMGQTPEGGAVVDGALRVHGVDGLRVVDASIMPTIINANTNVPTIAIAEKAADLIVYGG